MNLDLILDGVLDPARPEILLYIPTDNGPKLAGFEYMVPVGPPGAPIPDPAPPAPMISGVSFNGPMEGHGPDTPPHFDLHVWGWEANPAGMYEDWNASLSCPG